jgi:NAD(P)-dependent dehydrogenase (short-subunit alcohol dehydrogenase family)
VGRSKQGAAVQRITIINGGTQGLGEAVARRLAERGSSGLVIGGRSADRGEALSEELSSAGVPTIFVPCDMTDANAPTRLVDACEEGFGTITGVVNVAAATSRATLFDDTREHVDFQFDMNVKAPYFLIQAAAKVMVRDGGGSIVNVGSTTGHGGQTKLTAYAMSKAALAVMTKNLAFGLMRHGIRVNQVNPGWMDTESEHRVQIEQDGAPENWLEIAETARPMGRLVKPWEVANVIEFCLSGESGMMTGNCIDVDQSVQGAGDPPIPAADDTIFP